MPIGRAKSMGIREAFYMTFSYKEIRLCLAIGLAMLIVKGYCAQVRAGRSSQDGRRRTVGIQQPAVSSQRSAVSGQRSAVSSQVWRPSVQRSAFSAQVWRPSSQRSAPMYRDKAPFVPHLFCAAARFQPTNCPFPKCPLTSQKLSTGPNRGLSHLAVDKAVSSL